MMNPRALLSSWKSALFLLAAFCFAGWAGIAAVSSANRSSLSSDSTSVVSDGLAIVYPLQILGITSAFSDFDGDNKLDIAVGRQIGDDYAVTIHLTRRAGKTVLKSPRRPVAGVTLFAYDINNDGFPDIIAASPLESHPFAVWLGDGNGGFTAADQSRFASAFGFTSHRSYQDQSLPPHQEPFPGPMRPDCETPASAFANLEIEPPLFTAIQIPGRAERMDHSLPALRSPPEFFLL